MNLPYKFLRVSKGMLRLELPRYWVLGAWSAKRNATMVSYPSTRTYQASYLATGILGFALDAEKIIHWLLHLYWLQPEDQVTYGRRGGQAVEIKRIKPKPEIRLELFYSSLWWPKLKQLFKRKEQ
jgi:hypothetical protein